MMWRGNWDLLFRKRACCQPEAPLSEHLPFIHSRAEHSRESSLIADLRAGNDTVLLLQLNSEIRQH